MLRPLGTGPAAPVGGEGDALQADVMRFLAIIALCLLAVMALVRTGSQDADGAPEPPVAVPDAPAEAPAPRSPPGTTVVRRPVPPGDVRGLAPRPPEPAQPERPRDPPAARARPIPAAPPAAPEPEPVRPAEPLIAQPMPDPEPAAPLPQDPAAPQARAPSVAPPAPPGDAPAPPATAGGTAGEARPDAGLDLRFASEGDFLALVRSGAVTVHAWGPERRLGLSRSVRFVDARLPEELHEVLAATLPPQLRSAFAAATGGLAPVQAEARGWHFGVRLPPRTRRALGDWLRRVDRGVLLIDRTGGVNHVES
jgi:hypothetical protein